MDIHALRVNGAEEVLNGEVCQDMLNVYYLILQFNPFRSKILVLFNSCFNFSLIKWSTTTKAKVW